MARSPLSNGRLALLALAATASACIGLPRMQVRYAMPDDGPVSQIVQRQWMSDSTALRTAVQAAIAQAQGAGEASARDLQALGFTCSDAPATLCVHESSLRYRMTPAPPAAGDVEQTMAVRISALPEGPRWRVDVAIACGSADGLDAGPRLSNCNDGGALRPAR